MTLRQILPAQLFGAYFVSVVDEEDADGTRGTNSVMVSGYEDQFGKPRRVGRP